MEIRPCTRRSCEGKVTEVCRHSHVSLWCDFQMQVAITKYRRYSTCVFLYWSPFISTSFPSLSFKIRHNCQIYPIRKDGWIRLCLRRAINSTKTVYETRSLLKRYKALSKGSFNNMSNTIFIYVYSKSHFNSYKIIIYCYRNS